MIAGATCTELEAILAVDRQAIRFETDKLEALDEYPGPDAGEQRQIVATVEAKIEAQVKKLVDIKASKKCGADDASVLPPFCPARASPRDPKYCLALSRISQMPNHPPYSTLASPQASALPRPTPRLQWQIYERANEGKLNSARVIQRAQEGKLVSGAGTNCKQLDAIIAIDKDALQFERDKLKELQVRTETPHLSRAALHHRPNDAPRVVSSYPLATLTRSALLQPGPTDPRCPAHTIPWTPWPCPHLHHSLPRSQRHRKTPRRRRRSRS